MLSDPQIISLIRENFVPATDNDWYNRRRNDPIGEFFRKVADQGPRQAPSTRQGHYIFTPAGKLLGYNNNNTVELRLRFIKEAIAKWETLPGSEKKPGAVDVPPANELKLDPKYHANFPENGIALVVSERILKVSPEGNLEACTGNDIDHRWGHFAAVDRVWIQKSEWDQLQSISSRNGDPSIPDAILRRLVRYHLVDFTRGEPAFWRNRDIKALDSRVEATSSRELTLSGTVHVSNDQRGFEAEFRGIIELDPDRSPTRFDIVVLGLHHGDGPYTKGSRPGKTPLGLAFQLADPEKPEDRIRPQGSHSLRDYFRAERN